MFAADTMYSHTTQPSPRLWSNRNIRIPSILHKAEESAVVRDYLPTSEPITLPTRQTEAPCSEPTDHRAA